MPTVEAIKCLSRIVAAVETTPPLLAGTRLVAVDGPAGSGKTTLAETLAAELETSRPGQAVAVLHMDDLYEGWTGLDTRLEDRIATQLLEPLRAGRGARWQQYDWAAGHFDRWHDLAPPDVLVLEGCGSGAARFSSDTSLLVWLEADPATRIARGIARDGEQVRQHWLQWMELESGYFANNRTAQRADISCST